MFVPFVWNALLKPCTSAIEQITLVYVTKKVAHPFIIIYITYKNLVERL